MAKQSGQPRPPHPGAAPRWVERVVERIAGPAFADALLGDLAEGVIDVAARAGTHRAQLWYWWQLLRTVPSLVAVHRLTARCASKATAGGRPFVQLNREHGDGRIESLPRWYFATLVLGGLLLSCCWLFRVELVANPRLTGWLVPRPPVLPGAADVSTRYVREYISDGEKRETSFQSPEPAALIREYYRTELPRRGWAYEPPAIGSCSRFTGDIVVDVFRNVGAGVLAPKALVLQIGTQPESGRQHVIINETGHTGYDQPSSAPVPSVERALLGTWRAGGDGSEPPVDVCFAAGGGMIVFAGHVLQDAEYRWQDRAAIQVQSQWSGGVPVGADAERATAALCAPLPKVLRAACQTKVIDPRAYPAPAERVGPVPPGNEEPTLRTDAYPAPAQETGAYPAPAPQITAWSRIDGRFRVTVDGDRLTLQNETGDALDFERFTP